MSGISKGAIIGIAMGIVLSNRYCHHHSGCEGTRSNSYGHNSWNKSRQSNRSYRAKRGHEAVSLAGTAILMRTVFVVITPIVTSTVITKENKCLQLLPKSPVRGQTASI